MPDLNIIALAVLGFLLCANIHRKKKHDKPLVCPLNGNCDSVINSPYSKLFGVSLEIYGMLYYAFIIVAYVIMYIVPALHTPVISYPVVGTSIGAFLFSLYLVFIQAFKLKSWCVWCLSSALLSTLIAAFSLIKLFA